MSESLKLKLSDDAYDALRRRADAAGTTPSELAARTIEDTFAGSPVAGEAVAGCPGEEAAMQRFERHFGSVDLGGPTDMENAAIDADLVNQYAARHERT